MSLRFTWVLVVACSAPAFAGGGVAPFTSEHSARGVIYNMMLAPSITNPQDGFGMACADLDGDGDLDLVLLGRADGLVGVYENNGAGVFTNRSAASGIPASPAGCGVSAFDFDRDGDGDLDLVQNNYAGAVRLYMNNEGSRRAWLRLRIAGEGRVRDAIGASATVHPTGARGAALPVQWREVLCGGNGCLGQHELTLHFGLGDAQAVESVEVRWPADGAVQAADLAMMLGAWGAAGSPADLDLDGTVGAADLAVLLGNWGG